MSLNKHKAGTAPVRLALVAEAGAALDLMMMLLNCAGSLKRPETRTAIWYCWLGSEGCCAKLAGGNFYVLLGQRVDDVERGEAARGQLGGVEPEAHGVLALAEDDDRADTGDALERVGDIRTRQGSWR